MIPYIVFAFGGIIPRLLLPSMVNGAEPVSESIIKILFHGGDYWFLYTLFILFLVFPFVEKVIKRSDRILAFGCMLVLAIVSKCVPNFFCIRSVMWYLPFFCLGYFARENNVFSSKKIPSRMYDHKEWYAVIAIVALIICGYVHDKIDNRIITMIGAFVGVTASYLVALIMPAMLKPFERYSKYSLALYVLNGYWLVISRMLAVKVLGITTPAGIICINMIFDFYISYMLIKYVLSKIPVVRIFIGVQ